MDSFFNWIDFLILIIFLVYVWDGYHRGFLRLFWELLGILAAFVFALKFYAPISTFFQNILNLPDVYARPVSFLVVWFLAQFVFYIAGRYLSFYTPVALKKSKPNHYFGLVPAAIKGVIFVSVLLILLMVLPLSSDFKKMISSSLIGGPLVREMSKVENKMETIFSGDDTTTNTLTGTFLSESTKLDFTTTDITIDDQSEQQIISLINVEREKAGLNPLKENILVRNVARAHSRDMLIRGYFSHDTLKGENLSDRLKNAHVEYKSAAENIALAPTAQLAHMALMNSPKHKDNILDSRFTSVGIGVIDAGKHGLMVTQNFIK